ncbi:hypothetical protein Pfo_007032 [Paulownia fortunei]|nr:hypothetical protein Pfo_007032 [Paulownia fortunei]
MRVATTARPSTGQAARHLPGELPQQLAVASNRQLFFVHRQLLQQLARCASCWQLARLLNRKLAQASCLFFLAIASYHSSSYFRQLASFTNMQLTQQLASSPCELLQQLASPTSCRQLALLAGSRLAWAVSCPLVCLLVMWLIFSLSP